MIVLLQQGKGADMGATFGGGGGNTLFGASGADSFLTRTTTMIALLFMVTSVFLAVNVKQAAKQEGKIFQNVPETEAAPAVNPTSPQTDESAATEKAATPSDTTTTDAGAAPAPAAQEVNTADAAPPATAETDSAKAPAAEAPSSPPPAESAETTTP